MDIHEKIGLLRTGKGISQYEMADRLNIGQSAYFQIEKGKTSLTVSRLYEIAKILEVSIGELLDIEGTATAVEKTNEDTEGLKKRIGELEELYGLNKRENEKITNYFTDYIFRCAAEIGFPHGFSDIKIYDKYKKIVLVGNKNEILKEFKEELISIKEKRFEDRWFKGWFKGKEEQEKEHIDEIEGFKNNTFGGTSVDFDDVINYLKIRAFDAESEDKSSNTTKYRFDEKTIAYFTYEYVLVDERKQKAINFFLIMMYSFFDTSKNDIYISIAAPVFRIIESGVITDKILLNSYEKIRKIKHEDIPWGYKLNIDLEIVKIEE